MNKHLNILLGFFALIAFIAVGCSGAKEYSQNKIQNKINYEQTRENYERSVKNDVIFEGYNMGGLKEPDVITRLMTYSQQIDTRPREAKFDGETWEIVRKEQPGKSVNIQKTLDLLLKARPGSSPKPVVEKVAPKTSARVLDRNIVRIGSYTTRILDTRDARLNNIRIAAERLDYEKVQPGEEFSFNDVLGKRTVKKGYEVAPIIIKTEDGAKKAYGVGGGICQLSSTLYNSVLKADLKVTERHSHSKRVVYVPKGKDATVAYGSSNFKFVNTRNHPVMIRVFLYKNRLTVSIYENRNL